MIVSKKQFDQCIRTGNLATKITTGTNVSAMQFSDTDGLLRASCLYEKIAGIVNKTFIIHELTGG